MKQTYRVTPKKRKRGNRWIVQRTLDRKQVGKFRLRAEALAYKLELERSSPIDRLSVEDIDILLGNLKIFFRKLYNLKKNLNENK